MKLICSKMFSPRPICLPASTGSAMFKPLSGPLSGPQHGLRYSIHALARGTSDPLSFFCPQPDVHSIPSCCMAPRFAFVSRSVSCPFPGLCPSMPSPPSDRYCPVHLLVLCPVLSPVQKNFIHLLSSLAASPSSGPMSKSLFFLSSSAPQP